MYEIKVLAISKDQNLQSLSQFLWQKKVAHRIIEQDDEQWLLVGNENDAHFVHDCYQRFLQGDFDSLLSAQPKQSLRMPLAQFFLRAPVTLLALLLSVAGYFLVQFDNDFELVKYLTFFHFDRNYTGQVIFQLPQGDYWRLFTPVFLHFSVLHIVFNCLWLWDLGRRVEVLQGSYRMFGIVLLIGMGSNITQAIFADVGVFGGMSGVIYGLLGYGWVWSALRPQQSLQIPQAVINFMLIWLVACFFGVAEILGAGAVANAAHLGGLIMGMLLGLCAAIIAHTMGE
jgi:GlpG protein